MVMELVRPLGSLSVIGDALDHLHASDLPSGRSGNVEIGRIEVSEEDAKLRRLRMIINGRWGVHRSGTYTALYRDGALWMSDTWDERIDLHGVLEQAVSTQTRSVLINGLGIGMLVNALLHVPSVERIHVVEIDPDVIALVEPHYQKLAFEQGKTLVVHQGDAYTIKISVPIEGKIDIVWHDVWETISLDNLEGMTKLHRRYARRAVWQQSWKRPYLQREKEREKSGRR